MTDAEIFDEVIVTPRDAFPRFPDVRVIERAGWLQIVTPSLTTGGLNEVIHSVLDPAEADAIIDATIAGYRELGLKFRWNVGPGSAPADLGDQLAARGLVASWGRGMALTIGDTSVAADPAIAIESVDATNVDAFSSVMSEGWSLDAAPLTRLNRFIIDSAARRQQLFLARCEGELAACASYVAFPRSAYLIGGVVLPKFRRRGLYRALVQARLADARVRGIELATSHAREASSAPILESLGFTTICRFPMYFG